MTPDEILQWIKDHDAMLNDRAHNIKCPDAIYIKSVMMSHQPKPFMDQLRDAIRAIQTRAQIA